MSATGGKSLTARQEAMLGLTMYLPKVMPLPSPLPTLICGPATGRIVISTHNYTNMRCLYANETWQRLSASWTWGWCVCSIICWLFIWRV